MNQASCPQHCRLTTPDSRKTCTKREVLTQKASTFPWGSSFVRVPGCSGSQSCCFCNIGWRGKSSSSRSRSLSTHEERKRGSCGSRNGKSLCFVLLARWRSFPNTGVFTELNPCRSHRNRLQASLVIEDPGSARVPGWVRVVAVVAVVVDLCVEMWCDVALGGGSSCQCPSIYVLWVGVESFVTVKYLYDLFLWLRRGGCTMSRGNSGRTISRATLVQ